MRLASHYSVFVWSHWTLCLVEKQIQEKCRNLKKKYNEAAESQLSSIRATRSSGISAFIQLPFGVDIDAVVRAAKAESGLGYLMEALPCQRPPTARLCTRGKKTSYAVSGVECLETSC